MELIRLIKNIIVITLAMNFSILSINAKTSIPIYKVKVPQTNAASSSSNSQLKVVYLSDYQCNNCGNQLTKQGANWHKWSHDVIRYVINNIIKDISPDVPDGTVYDFSFMVDKNKQVLNFKIVNRMDNEELKIITNKNITKNLFLLKKEIEKLNKNAILTFPEKSIRQYTQMYVTAQIVQNTLYVNVTQVTDYDTSLKEGA